MTDLQIAKNQRGQLLGIHHVALIASNYERSKRDCIEVLECKAIAENYWEQHKSYKLDLELPNGSQLELLSFPDLPARPSRSEPCGLRHLAFRVEDVDVWKSYLEHAGVSVEDRGLNLRGEQTQHSFTSERRTCAECNFCLVMPSWKVQ
jgi:glyoxylase I family protein